MSPDPQKNDYRALLQQALVSLEQMETRLRSVEQAHHEPIAIIGMGFRFPGDAEDAASFWRLLYNGIDAISEIPADRWKADQFYDPDPDATGKMYTRWGGFLRQVDLFDPQFFGISPREAVSMDPQQRLLLETTWEALENAGQASAKLTGSRTGVFVGMVGSDYANLKMISGGIHDVDAYFGTGISRSIAAGRIAYTFGLHGPAVAVDTACSSSLVATHQACQSLRLKECDLAVAGGVNLILEPSGSISTSRARMMSFDGRCKTFDATADGYVRSEGCAMIVLKRLSDALVEGDPILAVIRGTAVNQDGRSNGLTAPNGKAQEAVIRAALKDAGLTPGDIAYVETHGTGTSLGDPIEVRALGAVFNEGHDSTSPLMIGSVKTNVGHLESAAGIVGLVKVVLALQNKTIPPHIHLEELNPFIPWGELPITVPTKPTEWTDPNGKPRNAGLSSFGFSGTNAHMVISEAPIYPVRETKTERPRQLFTLSAKTEAALGELVNKYETFFQQNPFIPLENVTYSINTGRSHFNCRLALTASSLTQASEKIQLWKSGKDSPGVHYGVNEEGKPEVAFLFTGQGSQYIGMAHQLYESQPAFRSIMEQCNEYLAPHLEKSLLSVLYPEKDEDQDLIHQTLYTQPALFSIEYSLAKLWQSWGVEPAVVQGHSIGEYVAACIAGVFSLEDGLKLIATRGRLMQSLPKGGIMVSVFADENRICEAIAPFEKEVSIAAVNGSRSVVISGREASVLLICEELRKEQIQFKQLKVSHAFHSPLMDPILGKFEELAGSIQYHSPQIGLVSNVTGKLVTDDSISNAAYWREHARRTVRFSEGIRELHNQGCQYFLEAGPNPTLLGLAQRCEPIQAEDVWLPSLRSGRSDWEQMLESLGQLYVRGQEINWDAFEGSYRDQRRRMELPTYPFQRERYWLGFETPASGSIESNTAHPLLGARLSTALPVFQNHLNAVNPPYLVDHQIHNIVVLPAAAYIEIALSAARHALDASSYSLEDVNIHDALQLFRDADRTTQIMLTPDPEGTLFQFFSRDSSDEQGTWKLHANGRIRNVSDDSSSSPGLLDELKARLVEPMSVEAYYRHLATVGAGYGPAFRGLREIWRTDGEALGMIELPDFLLEDADAYGIHPALLDACFQLLGAAVPGASDLDHAANVIFVPVGVRHLRILETVGSTVYCHIQLHPSSQASMKTLTGDLSIFDKTGRLAGIVKDLLLQQIDPQALQRAVQANVDPWFYEIDWIEQPGAQTVQNHKHPGNWLVLADDSVTSREFIEELKSRGGNCYLAFEGSDFERYDQQEWRIDPEAPEHFKKLLTEILEGLDKPLQGVVHLWNNQELPAVQAGLEEIHAKLERTSGSVLYLVQALAGLKNSMPRLWLVTQGAQPIDRETVVNPISTSVWGLGNVIALELPALSCTRIDLDPSTHSHPELFQEIWEAQDEDQVAFRGGKRHVARLVHGANSIQTHVRNEPVVLQIHQRGVLDNLTLLPAKRKPAGSGEVEIEVVATGLNFRDVLNVLGMYPGDAGPLGSECAGRVVSVGNGVTEFQVGDAVVALTSNSFGSYVTVPTEFVVPKPHNLSFTEAATIPIAFLTADYALNTLAKMKAGDRVLIHAAAGGVGLAAVQLAQRAGAEIFGTAGNDEKRKLLKTLGVSLVMSSRNLDFATETLKATDGKGVDIVLNSLAGEFIPKSLSVVKKSGCFVEIGRTGVWDEDRVRQINPEIRYSVLFLGEILEKNPLLIKEMLLGLLADFETGKLKPLPQQVFPVEKSVEAFRFMAQARHTGKVVITQKPTNPRNLPHSDATYLITGGLGGLGLVSARWLEKRGAKNLVLVSRNDPTEEAARIVDEIRSTGINIHLARLDISDSEKVEGLLQYIHKNLPPLRGIIHAAGVLDDGVLLEQNWTRFQTVMAPKIDGAWNLHRLTQSIPLDFFISFSAGASFLGSAGQGNYATANAFLDGLAHYRRSFGLPALSINWGAWAEVGMASRLAGQNNLRWHNQGIDLIKPVDGMRAMEKLIEHQSIQMAVLPINWHRHPGQQGETVRPLLRGLVNSSPGTNRTTPQQQRSFLNQLGKTAPEEQLKFLSMHLTRQINSVLGLDPEHLPSPRQGFTDMGLDSLMAVELSNRLQKDFERSLPSTLTFEYPTIEALTRYLATEILDIAGLEKSQDSPEKEEKRQQAITAEVEEIPEDKLEDEILKELRDAGY